VDLAKSLFSVCEVDGTRHVLRRQDFKRDACRLAVQQPGDTVVAMDACSGAHWRANMPSRSAPWDKPVPRQREAAANGSDPPGENLTN